MAADHQIDPGVGTGLGDVALPVIRHARVLLAAVHVHHDHVGRRAGGGVVLRELLVIPRHGVVVVGKVAQLVAVLAIGVGKEAHADAVDLHHVSLLALLLAGIGADDGEVGEVLPHLQRVLDGARPVVVGVVRVGAHHVEARVGESLRHGVGRVVAGVAAVAPVGVAAHDRLLVHEGQVVGAHDGGDLAVERREVVHAVALARPAPHVGYLERVLVREVVAHSAEAELFLGA